jgi:DNA-binding response OmpR family regulator
MFNPAHAIQELGNVVEGQMGARLLVVDDDDLLRSGLAFSLEQSGFRVWTAANAEDAIVVVNQNLPDLIILDILLPGMDGLSALQIFRDTYHIPVIFLTARHRELDQVLGLELGADDYITKPFNHDVLIAHIHAVLRRATANISPPASSSTLVCGDIEIDQRSRTVIISGKPVSLTPKEFDLLFVMALEPNQVFTIDTLLNRVWGAEYSGEPQIVYVHIRWLREKIEQDPQHPKHILNIRGIGYKLATHGST